MLNLYSVDSEVTAPLFCRVTKSMKLDLIVPQRRWLFGLRLNRGSINSLKPFKKYVIYFSGPVTLFIGLSCGVSAINYQILTGNPSCRIAEQIYACVGNICCRSQS